MTTEAIVGLAIIYLIVHAVIVVFTKKLSWSARSVYEKIVTILGIVFAILLAIGSASLYFNPEGTQEIYPSEMDSSGKDVTYTTYSFSKYNVSIDYPSYFVPSEYPSEEQPYQITAFYDGNSNSPVVVSVSDVISTEMMKTTITETYGTPTAQNQKTINGKTFDIETYPQSEIYSSMDLYYLQEGETMFVMTFYNHVAYDEETDTFLKESAEKMLETLKLN